MAEFKIVFYVIIGIGYLLYKVYTKNKEKIIENKPIQTNKNTSSKSIQEILAEIKQQAEAIQQPAPIAKPKAKAPAKVTTKPKDLFIKETVNTNFEEGVSSVYQYEDTFQNNEMKNEPTTITQSIAGNKEVDSILAPDLQKAFVASLIFERKF